MATFNLAATTTAFTLQAKNRLYQLTVSIVLLCLNTRNNCVIGEFRKLFTYASNRAEIDTLMSAYQSSPIEIIER